MDVHMQPHIPEREHLQYFGVSGINLWHIYVTCRYLKELEIQKKLFLGIIKFGASCHSERPTLGFLVWLCDAALGGTSQPIFCNLTSDAQR